ELAGKVGPDEVGASAEHLAELDEGGAKLGERETDAGFLRELAEPFAVEADEAALQPFVVEPAEPVGQAITAKDGDDFADALGVAIQAGEHLAGSSLSFG